MCALSYVSLSLMVMRNVCVIYRWLVSKSNGCVMYNVYAVYNVYAIYNCYLMYNVYIVYNVYVMYSQYIAYSPYITH